MQSLAIVGAGIAGSLLARALQEKYQVHVFEKSRGPGGRMSTRRSSDYSWHVDHGAQFFTLREESNSQFLEKLELNDVFAPWNARVVYFKDCGVFEESPFREPHYVAVPAMNSLCKKALQDLKVTYNARITELKREEVGSWSLITEKEAVFGNFDWVVLTAPLLQSVELLPGAFENRNLLATCEMESCFALCGPVEEEASWDAAYFYDSSKIRWMARNSSKPGREGESFYVAHSDSDFALELQALEKSESLKLFHKEVKRVSGLDFKLENSFGHFWRYARAQNSIPGDYAIDSRLQLAVASDCFPGTRVEGAIQSARSLARMLSESV